MISKDVDPAPITTPARSDSVAAVLSPQDPLDLEPRRDVRGELVLGDVGHQAGQVDDPADAVLVDGVAHVLGGQPVPRPGSPAVDSPCTR